jgi:hypothetical protein
LIIARTWAYDGRAFHIGGAAMNDGASDLSRSRHINVKELRDWIDVFFKIILVIFSMFRCLKSSFLLQFHHLSLSRAIIILYSSADSFVSDGLTGRFLFSCVADTALGWPHCRVVST